jgi:phospholipid/cholesterol/gamma-HCH transport system permease protein
MAAIEFLSFPFVWARTSVDTVGIKVLSLLNAAGDFTLFLVRALKTAFTTRLNRKQLFLHMQNIGVGSFSIIFLTGCFTGLALALQSFIGFSRVGTEEFTGLVVTLGMTRELGPVLTGLMVTGRVGSSMAAEIGSMQITEQVDALKTLCINPYQYLIVPRIFAATFIMPFLTIFSMICGIVSSYLLCIYILGINGVSYLSIIRERTELSDITGGLFKAAFFGLILAWVGSYCGFVTTGGARGVGRSTTRSVVVGSILILVANYLLSSFLYKTGLS